MAFEIVNDFPNEIMNETEGPFISLYQPTHRHRPTNQQDVIRYKNLLKKAEESLREGYTKKETGKIIEPFHALAGDVMFWNNTLDGLAILATKERGVIYKLKRPVKELVVVADSFHIKPLIRAFQSADRYQLLGLSRSEFALYEGNRYGFEEVDLGADTPRTAEDAIGAEYSEKYLTHSSYTGTRDSGLFHGHGGKKEERDKYTESFFRYVDRFVLENYSKPSNLPLILVSLSEHHPMFQSVSRNPFLMKEGVRIAFDALSIEKLKTSVWEHIEPLYLEKTAKLVEAFRAAHAKFMASDDLSQIARGARDNRVATLLLESDRIVAGKVDIETGRLIEGYLAHPEYDDVLDDLAEMVFTKKGQVVVLPKERMPSTTGAAAIFRY